MDSVAAPPGFEYIVECERVGAAKAWRPREGDALADAAEVSRLPLGEPRRLCGGAEDEDETHLLGRRRWRGCSTSWTARARPTRSAPDKPVTFPAAGGAARRSRG